MTHLKPTPKVLKQEGKILLLYCQETKRELMYSYGTLIYIWDKETRKYYFTKDYRYSVTTSRHRNYCLGFTLTDKVLNEMIKSGKAEML